MKKIGQKFKLTLFLFPLFFITIGTSCSCINIPYHADEGFLNSAQANSFEFLVYVNNKPCKDMDGLIGLCSKRIKSNENVEFKIDPLQYSYRLNVTCTKELQYNFTKDYPANAVQKFIIPSAQYQGLKTFVCIGEIFPTDRPEEISFKWQIRVEITDQKYAYREQIYKMKKGLFNYLVFGQNAKYSRAFYKGKWHYHKNRAWIMIPRNVEIIASSESEMGRFNYFGY